MPSQSASPGDEEILAAVQALQGGASSDAFEVIYRRYYRSLYHFFANRPALREDADDLANEALERVYEGLHQYTHEAGASFHSWLWTIAENVWKNAVRERTAAKRTLPGQAVDLPADGARDPVTTSSARPVPQPRNGLPDPEQAVLAYERTRVLRQAIEALPPGMRRCIELRLLRDLQYQEIANVTGIGLNSVRSQLFEARQRLKSVLDDYFQGADF